MTKVYKMFSKRMNKVRNSITEVAVRTLSTAGEHTVMDLSPISIRFWRMYSNFSVEILMHV